MSSDTTNDFLSYSIDKINSSNQSSLLAINDTWILPIFVLCLLGLLCTIILSLIFIYLSTHRSNDHVFLTNLFICFSLGFIYLILIIFLIRSNEILCSLREFLSQLSYAFLYSALLSRYIMQWLGTRILSKRTKYLTSLLIYTLLICTQIPIGILWWYFTRPRACQQATDMNVFSSSSNIPNFFFHFHRSFQSKLSCSNRCTVDYRFYATFTYTIIQLILCTIISICLFFCRHCRIGERKLTSTNGYNRLLNCLSMFAFIFIDFIWLTWTMIYYFTHPFYIYPTLIISMFSIATICLLFILLPQIYYYSKIKINDIEQYQAKAKAQSTTLFSNKLASNEQELLVDEKKTIQKTESELSYELGESGTFLPITRTPKGPFKVFNHEKKPIEKLDELIYGDDHHKTMNTNEIKVDTSANDIHNQHEHYLQPPMAPLQRQSTSSSVASDFVSYRHPQSDALFYTAYPPPRRDETIIPILCTSERPRTSTPVQMRILVNSTPSSSVPTTRRLYSSNDLRHVRQPHPRIQQQPPPPPVYYSPQPQQYLYFDPYRTTPSHVGGNTWQSVLLQPTRSTPSSSYRRFPYDNRSLSQRLWDIDSGDDDDDDVEEDIIKVVGRHTPPPPTSSTSNVHFHHPDENILLHIDDDEEEEEEEDKSPIYKKQYAHV